MITAKAVGVAATAIAGVTTAAATNSAPVSQVSAPVSGIAASTPPDPVLFDLLGVEVPVLPVLIGVLTAALVRVITVSSSPTKIWSYNAAVTLLAMMGTATFITDHRTGPGMSFWVGTTFGAVGVGIVHAARSKLFMSILDSVKSGIAKGVEDDTPHP
jgi:hypothetical protein